MKKTSILAALLFSIVAFPQVGINTTEPTAIFDVNGNTRIRQIPNGIIGDSILVTNNGFVRKIALSDIEAGSNSVCPRLDASSNGYHLLFKSDSSIPKPNNPLVIQNMNFTGAGTWTSNNTYFFSYSNTTGTPLNLTSFTVNFSGLVCNYKK